MADVTFGLIQRQSHACQPRLEQLLTVLKDHAVLMEYHAVIGIGDDPSARVAWVMASSMPCRAISANNGEIVPPCGVPAVVGTRWLSSRIPAWSQAFSCRRRQGDTCVLAKRAAGLMRSKHCAMSTFSAYCGRNLIELKIAS